MPFQPDEVRDFDTRVKRQLGHSRSHRIRRRAEDRWAGGGARV